MKIVFDLDGTLICSKKRLFELFSDLVESNDLTFESYWNLKFLGYSNQDILKANFQFSASEIQLFTDNWMKNIESDNYLKMDTLINGTQDLLYKISKTKELYICTARQSKSQVIMQLNHLGIFDFFKDIFVTEQKKTKTQILEDSDLCFSGEDWFVGDTGHDIMTGKGLGMTTFAVLSGFMPEDRLRIYSPNFIINDITDLGF